MSIQPDAPLYDFIPRPESTPEEPHLIGQEWAGRYQSFHIPVLPEPCIIDGTPLNACTGRIHDHDHPAT